MEETTHIPDRLARAADRMQDAMADTLDQGQKLSRSARREVRNHPTAAVAIALGTGLVAGTLIGAAAARR